MPIRHPQNKRLQPLRSRVAPFLARAPCAIISKLPNSGVILSGAVFQAKRRISVSPGIARKPDKDSRPGSPAAQASRAAAFVWSSRSRPLLLALSCRAEQRTERSEVHCAVEASLPARTLSSSLPFPRPGRARVHSCRLGILRIDGFSRCGRAMFPFTMDEYKACCSNVNLSP